MKMTLIVGILSAAAGILGTAFAWADTLGKQGHHIAAYGIGCAAAAAGVSLFICLIALSDEL